MALFEGKTPAERNKTIAALVLGGLALLLVVRMLSSGSSNTNKAQTNAKGRQTGARTTRTPLPNPAATNEPDPSLVVPTPININFTQPAVPAPGRNIFAFYVPPPPTVKPSPTITLLPPTPEPTPPLLLAGLSPSNVMARTGEFTLQVSGDKFTPQSRVYIDGQETPTRFSGAQQLSAEVPATLITVAGTRRVEVRTPDGVLFSNPSTLNVAQPPAPSYTFVGVLVKPGGNDVAILKDPKGDLLNVQRGDLLGGRFRVTSISPRTVEFTDAQLKIKHTLSFVVAGATASGFNAPPRPTPAREDDEPAGDAEPEL